MSDSRLRFSFGGFAIAVGAIGLGTIGGLTLIPVVGSMLGMLVGGFVAGLLTDDRPLLEAGTAASLASLGLIMAGGFIGNGIGAAVAALGSVAPTTVLASVTLSFVVGAFGAHFGNDLRDGLTAPIEESPTRTRDTLRRPSPASEPTGSDAEADAGSRESLDDQAGVELEGDADESRHRDVELDRN